MEMQALRSLWDYHWWANRRLFEAAATLGEETARKDVGKQFSLPTLKGMLAHIYGADALWLERWKGNPAPRLMSDADFPSMADLRVRWDAFEKEQRAFVEALTPLDRAGVVHYTDTRGNPYSSPLWQMLQHVPNHATHHRSEIATMLTTASGAPPPTDLIVYYRITSGQQKV